MNFIEITTKLAQRDRHIIDDEYLYKSIQLFQPKFVAVVISSTEDRINLKSKSHAQKFQLGSEEKFKHCKMRRRGRGGGD